MFFKKKKEANKPTREQVEQYGKHIYAILCDSDDATPFDSLVCDAFTYFWMIEKSGLSEFLVVNLIAKIDAIIATTYMNAMVFINGVKSTEIKQEYTSIYFNKTVQVICKEYPAFSSFVSEMFSSRIKLYNSVTEKYASNLQSIIDCVFEELQHILAFDKVEQTYKPYTQDSPLIILGFNDLMACQEEIRAYKNVYNTLYGATNEQINRVLVSLDSDSSFVNNDAISVRYEALRKALLGGLEKYTHQHPSQVLEGFRHSLEDYFSSFLNKEPAEEYRFSISVRDDSSIEYVEFNFEECVLEVTCGGSLYSPGVGSDSYTNWFYSIWDDGSEENDSISVESFDIIYEILNSKNARISIESPDDFYYPEMDTVETDVAGLQNKIHDINSNDVIEILSLWDMEPSQHGRMVRIYGHLWNKQIDTLKCILYAEHFRGHSVTERVELEVNLTEPLPQFLWKKPRIYKTEIPIVGRLVYNHTDESFRLIDAKYDEYWRDENGNILCRGLECLHSCSDQCPIHCNNVAKALANKADYEGAISVLKKATEKTLDYVDNWLVLASCYSNLSMHEEAEDLYFKVLELDQTNIQAIYELSIISLRMGKFANAQKYASIYGRNKDDAHSLEISRLIQQELLQYSNLWPSYKIPDTVWDSIRQENTTLFWDMVLTQKLSNLAFVTSSVSTLEYKRWWNNLKNNRMDRDAVAEMRAALKENAIENTEAMCVFDVITRYEKEFIKY